MKTIFDPSAQEELITRINRLSEGNTAQWGKMNLHQMLKHCTFWDEWVQGKTNLPYKQTLMGRIFGKWALHGMVKDDKPLKRNIPAGEGFSFKDAQGNVAQQKEKWSRLIADYTHYSNPRFIHDFFGKMSREQIGILAYKHADHHLRQFGC